MVICLLRVRRTASLQQLKDLGATLQHWSDAELDTGACCPQVDTQVLSDLLAGELPKPGFLRVTADLRQMDEVRRILGLEPEALEPYQLQQLKDELGEEAQNRDVVVFIDCSPGFSYEDTVKNLQAAVSKDVVEEIQVREVKDDTEDA